MGDEALMI